MNRVVLPLTWVLFQAICIFATLGLNPPEAGSCRTQLVGRKIASVNQSMMISHNSGTLKKLKRTPWRFQQTFVTPLNDVERFVDTIALSHPDLSGASLVVEVVVFEPKHPPAFLSDEAWCGLGRDTKISVECADCARSLLVAGLSNWLDFFFIPDPKPFVIFADHDEYCTFYANTRSNLNKVSDSLVRAGFQAVDGFERKTQ